MKKGFLLRVLILSLSILVFPVSHIAQAQGVLKLGVLAKRGAQVAKKKWGSLADYLGEATGTRVVLVPLSFVAIEPAVQKKKIDYLLANPGFFVDLNEKYGVKALATMLNKRQNKALDQFGGVIFVKADSPIDGIADIKGKKFMCVKKTSFGGGQMAFRHLIEKGVDPFKDVTLLEGKKHDSVVMAVKKGIVDVGTVRSDILERMESEGKIKLSQFKVLDKANDSFPFVHTTRLYPEWPFAALSHVSDDTNKKILDALLALKPGSPAAKAGKIVGWKKPLDYTQVAECLRIVRTKMGK